MVPVSRICIRTSEATSEVTSEAIKGARASCVQTIKAQIWLNVWRPIGAPRSSDLPKWDPNNSTKVWFVA